MCGIGSEDHYEKYNCNLDVHHLFGIESFYDRLPIIIRTELHTDGPPSNTAQNAIAEVTNRANDPTNLVTVCTPCHNTIERLSVKEQVALVGTTVPEVQPTINPV